MMDALLMTFQYTGNPEVVPGVFFRWYTLMFLISFVLGYYLLKKIFIKEKAPLTDLERLVNYVVLATIIGARLGHVLFYQPAYYFAHPSEILMVWEGGLASHGGAIGIIVALLIYSKKSEKNFWWTIDRLVIVTALAACFIRLGNFFNHEIYGKVTDLPWAVQFMINPFDPAYGMTDPVHPTQIYEALCYLIIFLFLAYLYLKTEARYFEGRLFGWFFTLLFTARFFIEALKEVQVDEEVAFIAKYGVNYGQLLSVPFVIVGVYLVVRSKKHKVAVDKLA